MSSYDDYARRLRDALPWLDDRTVGETYMRGEAMRHGLSGVDCVAPEDRPKAPPGHVTVGVVMGSATAIGFINIADFDEVERKAGRALGVRTGPHYKNRDPEKYRRRARDVVVNMLTTNRHCEPDGLSAVVATVAWLVLSGPAGMAVRNHAQHGLDAGYIITPQGGGRFNFRMCVGEPGTLTDPAARAHIDAEPFTPGTVTGLMLPPRSK